MCSFSLTALLLGLVGASPALATSTELAPSPVRVIEASLEIPEGMDTAVALASVHDMASIFEAYEPVVPKIPGVRLDLDKELVSDDGPTIVELPVEGSVFGRDIDERARITATSAAALCGDDTGSGVMIVLDFEASSYNIERRIDRIEITACPGETRGRATLDAVGRMYAGYNPEDPELNALKEAIGSKAMQGAFIKQVPAMFTAVEAHWDRVRGSSSAR